MLGKFNTHVENAIHKRKADLQLICQLDDQTIQIPRHRAVTRRAAVKWGEFTEPEYSSSHEESGEIYSENTAVLMYADFRCSATVGRI